MPEEPQAQKAYNRVEAYLDKYTTYGGTAPGDIYYVDSVAGANTNDGLRKDRAVATIEYANANLCTANNGDIVFVLPVHNEAVSAAAGLDLDTAGVTYAFLGEGQDRAKITFGTTSTADMDIDAASITMIRPRFVAAVDALAGPIDVNATDFTMVDALYEDAASIDTTDAVVATAGATRLKIHGYKYQRGDEGGTQKESHIQLNGVDHAELCDIHIHGDFNAACIENVTDELLYVKMKNIMLINTNSDPSPGMVLDSNCDGSAENVNIRVASGATYVDDVADINWVNCYGTGTDGANMDDPIGTATAASPEGKIDTIDGYHDVPTADTSTNAVMRDVIGNKDDAAAAGAVSTAESIVAYTKQAINLSDSMNQDSARYVSVTADMSSATWNTQAAHEIATVTGTVRLRIVPEVTVNLAGAAATVALGTETTSNAFIGATTATELDAGEIWQAATPASNVKYLAVSSIKDYIVNDDDVGYTIAGGATSAGTIVFHMWWDKVSSDGAVAAGAGGAL
jgi:hypothetical protein